jgi:hypothetical protein
MSGSIVVRRNASSAVEPTVARPGDTVAAKQAHAFRTQPWPDPVCRAAYLQLSPYPALVFVAILALWLCES